MHDDPRIIVHIDGHYYDATNLKHPGGSIIRLMNSAATTGPVDATTAFREFHARSARASAVLATLPRLEGMAAPAADARRAALTRDFAELRRQLSAEGAFDPSPAHVALRCAELVALFAVSFWLLSLDSRVAVCAGMVVNGVAQGRCGWLMHEGAHGSLTGDAAFDRRIAEVAYAFGCGMSTTWWRSQHNKHHAATQKLGYDVDLDTLPLLAFNRRVAARVARGSLAARWLSVQAYMFPLACFLVGLFWSLYLHPRHIARTRRIAEAVWVTSRYVGWLGLMRALGYSPLGAAGLYLLCFAVGCTYTFVNFALSHTHLPVAEPDEHLHWVEYSSLHTTNVGTGSALVTWWMSYLNFQIEHHLFPTMPQLRLPHVAPRVRLLFATHGLPYHCAPYTRAIRATFANLHAVGNGD
jgi:fatty acid desaturase 2 (delta-6 desaturase)